MQHYRATAEGNIPYTEKENALRDREVSEWLAAIPMRDWEREMSELDRDGMTHDLENVIATLSAAQKEGLDSVTKDKFERKQALRKKKPLQDI